MKIVKLPADYRRYLDEGKHIVWGQYEYWGFIKAQVKDCWRIGYKRRPLNGGDIEEVKVV